MTETTQVTQTQATATMSRAALQDVLAQADTLVTELTLTLFDGCLRARVMDPSHVSLLDIDVPAPGTGTAKFAIRVEEAMGMLRRIETDTVTLRTPREGAHATEQVLSIEGGDYSGALRLIETSATETPLPATKMECRADMTRASLLRVVERLDSGDYITMAITTDGKLTMQTSSDSGHASIRTGVAASGPVSETTYSREYLKPFLSAAKKFAPKAKKGADPILDAVLEWTPQRPCRIRIMVGGGHADFWLAPRVEG